MELALWESRARVSMVPWSASPAVTKYRTWYGLNKNKCTFSPWWKLQVLNQSIGRFRFRHISLLCSLWARLFVPCHTFLCACSFCAPRGSSLLWESLWPWVRADPNTCHLDPSWESLVSLYIQSSSEAGTPVWISEWGAQSRSKFSQGFFFILTEFTENELRMKMTTDAQAENNWR